MQRKVAAIWPQALTFNIFDRHLNGLKGVYSSKNGKRDK